MLEGLKDWRKAKISTRKIPQIAEEVIKNFKIPFDKIGTTEIQEKVSEISTKAYDFSKPEDINAAQKDWNNICNFIKKYNIYIRIWETFYDTKIKGTTEDYVILDKYEEAELHSDWYDDNSFEYFVATIRNYHRELTHSIAVTIEPSNELYDKKFHFEKLPNAYKVIQLFIDRINENKGK